MVFLCLLAVSWNGQGLSLSGLIREAASIPLLSRLLKANILSVFLSVSLVIALCCLAHGAEPQLPSLSFFLSFYRSFFPHVSRSLLLSNTPTSFSVVSDGCLLSGRSEFIMLFVLTNRN